ITGRVTDPSGAVVPGVQITAVHLATNTARSTTTNDQGNYVLPDLQVGKYLVKAEHPGFKSFTQQNVSLDADAIATVNIALEIGTSQETVTVSSAPPAIQTESGEISNLVTGVQVSELSLNGRNFSQYLTFSPGVASAQTGTRLGVGQEGNPLLSINGGLINDTTYSSPGILVLATGYDRRADLTSTVHPLQEIEIKTSNHSAPQGRKIS